MTPRYEKPVAYPELIRAGNWRVDRWAPGDGLHDAPCTAGEEMYLPVGNTPFAKEVKFHELLHVKHSPREVPTDTGASMPSLLASEDCRVNLKGQLVRKHDALGHSPELDAVLLITSKSERGMAQVTAGMMGYASSGKYLARLYSQLDDLAMNRSMPQWFRSHAGTLRDALDCVRDTAPDYCAPYETSDFDDAIRLAKWIDDNFEDGMPNALAKKGSELGEDGKYGDKANEGGNRERSIWGEMQIKTPPLSIRHATSIGTRTTASETGNRIGHWNRLVTGEIFGRMRRRAVPGAVLIDQSGSMHWNPSKLHELVRRMPVGIVAGYCGGSGVGVLKILAKDGCMVEPSEVKPDYGGNEIDGPALRWLANQRGRKVWVSDEAVCSDACDDEDALLADCRETQRRAGIRVTCSTDPGTIIRAMRGLPAVEPVDRDDEDESDDEEDDGESDYGEDDEE